MPATDSHESFDTTEKRHTGLAHGDACTPVESRTATQSLIRATRAELLVERQAMVLAIVAELLGPADLERALDAFVGALQQRLGASRVSLALVTDDGKLQLGAISQQARIDLASNEVRLLLNVMDECLENECMVRFPVTEDGFAILPAHQSLAAKSERTTLVTVPLYQDGTAIGVLLLERHNAEPFISTTLQLLKHIAFRCAPTLSLRRDAERSAFGRARRAFNNKLGMRLCPGSTAKRLLLAVSLAIVVFTMLAPLPQGVTAQAELVPREQRLVTAPFDGFIESVVVEPGKSVVAGQLLATLETRELELEGTRHDGEIGSVEAEFRAAMAGDDRQSIAVARARLERERALRAVIDQRLDRIELRAPIDGLIANGDPADAIGAPVSQGDTLFIIAQADEYDVHLFVHEHDIHKVNKEQKGSLTLRARPTEELSLRVHAIHPVAESVDGASRFRVRTTLTLPPGITPRPGESGVARLHVGTSNLMRMLGEPITRFMSKLWWRLSI